MMDTTINETTIKTSTVEDILKSMVEISANTNNPMTKADAKRALDAVKNAICAELEKGNKVQITGFMTISPVFKPVRKVFNIATSQPMETKENIAINARVGESIRKIARNYSESIFNVYKDKYVSRFNPKE